MIYKIITGIYLLKVMQVAIVYYNIKSINSLTRWRDCNVQKFQTSGKSCYYVCWWKCFTKKVLCSDAWFHI